MVFSAVEETNRRLLRARDALDRRFAEPLDVTAAARIAVMSPAHFTRSFKAVFAETPHRYLRRRRVERAMASLRDSDRSVTRVGFEVGFGSLGTFSRTFTAIVGVPRRRTGCAAPAPLPVPGPLGLGEETAAQVRDLLTKGAFGLARILTTDDCRKTYADLRAKGVEFSEESTEQPYGIDCALRDPFGNHIRITQPTTQLAEITERDKRRWAEGASADRQLG